MYFSEHKLAIEVDEKGYTDKDGEKKENQIEEKVKKDLRYKLIRINPDAGNYDIFVETVKINGFFAQSNKEAEIKELKDKIKN